MLLTREERAGQQCRFAQSLSRFGEARQLIPSLGRPEPVLEGEFTLRPGLWVEDQDVVNFTLTSPVIPLSLKIGEQRRVSPVSFLLWA